MARTLTLLACFSEDFTEADVQAMRTEVAGLAERPWTLEPPEFIDETDDDSCLEPEDEPIRTVGALLLVTHPDDAPRTPVEELEAFVTFLADFAKRRNVEFELEINDTYTGTITPAGPDEYVRRGLLESW